jgi:hypothetical protein
LLSWFSSCFLPRLSAALFVSFQLYYPQDLEGYSSSSAGFLWKRAVLYLACPADPSSECLRKAGTARFSAHTAIRKSPPAKASGTLPFGTFCGIL